jgi:hypothetical protein
MLIGIAQCADQLTDRYYVYTSRMATARKVSSPQWTAWARANVAGAKCKFSHDPNVGRKVDKVNLYEDVREDQKKGTCLIQISNATESLANLCQTT